ncbi:sugar-binding transcriptional regulator [Frigidibacter sp. RF13]|uniref:sugar-binding transcriptional regulator n=1 Tax=Frigidibacter sp. RF13 TaxID=2997340 RepID=UPI00226FD2AB|nr:sugar-binding transcriptional regulator [Frigidibacter sp. RF13]MCY1127236.1 sugar-binding transcriptional regulator [Frigidibacter sp. RF13]
MTGEPTLLDEAARAGWLSHVAGMTQDQIAAELGVSRQRAQRLVSKAMAEGLVKVRLDHKIGRCLELEAGLIRTYGLQQARVAPDLGQGADPARATAGAAASLLESYLARPESLTIAFGTGRALSAMVAEIATQPNERHKIVSLIGNIAPDGSASFYDVIMRLADKLHAPHYPMPVPLISETPQERAMFHALRPVQTVATLAQEADVVFVGVGQMGEDAPLYKDGFVTRAQLQDMQAKGAAGEIVGGVFDRDGRYIETPISALVGGVRVEPGRAGPVIAVAAGPTKVSAIRAALTGRIVNCLVTDEPTASALLSQV